MNRAKCSDTDYINFLIATPLNYSCVEAAKVQPEGERKAAHDALNRLLHRIEPDPETLWQESAPSVQEKQGIVVVDDSTLDKPYARKMELVTHHYSGKHGKVVKGINLVTLLWTDGDRHIPCDYRIYDKQNDGLSKNDHLQAMMQQAHQRGFEPDYVLFDSWYSSLDNLKLICTLGWCWLTQLKSNRTVNPDGYKQVPLATVNLSSSGTIVWLKGYGKVKVFKIVATNGDVEFWATNNLGMDEMSRLQYAERAWAIEEYHRGVKQFCGIEKAQHRSARAQRNHIGLAIRSFLRLEHDSFHTGHSWFEAKAAIIRRAVSAYLAHPFYTLETTTA